MEKNAVKKIESYFRLEYFSRLLAGAITPVIAAAAAVSLASIFFAIDGLVGFFLIGAACAKIASVFFRASRLRVDPKDCYRALDETLELRERAVTCYETVTRPLGACSDPAFAALVREDFARNFSAKASLFDDDRDFGRVFVRHPASFSKRHYYLIGAVAALSVLNAWQDYSEVSAGRVRAAAEAETREVPKEAAKVLDALIETGADKLKAADAVEELRQAREKLREPQTQKELAKNLRDAAEKLKRIQQGENKKSAMGELDRIKEAAEELVSGRAGEGLEGEDKKMVEERLKEFKKLVDDYLKSSNDKDFTRIEKELSELASLLQAKKEAAKKAAAEKASGAAGGRENAGGAGEKKMSAEEKSALKHLDRLSGKELLEKLKNDKQLQELYAALSAMSAEAEERSQCGRQPGGQGGAGDEGKDGKGGKEGAEGKPGEGGKGAGISPEALGINIPKPGKGSSNMKAEGGEAPLMAPQDRQKAGQTEKKAGQWKAFFEAERFEVDAKKSKVEGAHDAKAPSMTIEGKSLPEPGTAGARMGEMVRMEKSSADSMVSGDAVPDELKKPVADYFKKLNNDFEGEKNK